MSCWLLQPQYAAIYENSYWLEEVLLNVILESMHSLEIFAFLCFLYFASLCMVTVLCCTLLSDLLGVLFLSCGTLLECCTLFSILFFL